ncbi:FIST C-terminal domain-containing protein, partial [Staphylococcus epidermidis]|uniref:FIST C-terminal domain-containing protein n=1 Tax=Staphylococcus epidermidis TaxID=1282 RepID=UPI003393C68E
RTKELLEQTHPRRPIFALYINCAGRAAAYCGTEGEDATEVQRAIGPDIPLLGVYCGVEVAPVGADLQPLDWSGVLCLFTERE